VRRGSRPRAEAQRGSALIEFVVLALILLIPLMYILLAVFDVQRGAYGAAAAARAGARAYNLAGSDGQAAGAALSALHTSADQALDDQGVKQWASVGAPQCSGGCLQRGSITTLTVTVRVPLPLPGIMSHWHAPVVTVSSTHSSPYGAYTE
jgi:fermentation-respiration switch protein FrsA (DUF1100 family)